MPKIVNKEKMRADILQAAVRAFSTHGFHNTTMNLIAKEAGIAKGTLYLYFDSKEALSIAFVESYFSRMESWLTQQGYASTLQTFLENIEHSLLIGEKEAKFIPLFFEAFGPSFHSDEFKKAIADAFDSMGYFYAENLRRLQTKGEVDATFDCQARGRVLVSMLDGIMLHYGLFDIERIRYEKMVREALLLFKQGLITPPLNNCQS